MEEEKSKSRLNGGLESGSRTDDDMVSGEEKDENELDVTIEEEEEGSGLWEAWEGELSLSQDKIQTSDGQREKRSSRDETLHLVPNSSEVGGK